jgi:hypothetical protein
MTEPPPHLRYRNAKPHNDFIDHWPTIEERDALQAAKRMADAKFAQGHHGAMTTSHVPIRGGQGARATVWRDAPQSYAAWIQAPNSTTQTGWMSMKAWWGVPEAYNDYGLREGPMSRHNVGGGPVNIYGPPVQQHVVEEHVHLYRQRIIHNHWLDDQHVNHGAPPPTDIHVEPSQVNYHASEQVIQQVHKPKGFFAFLFSPTAPQRQQQALPSPQPQYRGQLRAEPAPMRQQAALPQQAPQPQQQFRLPPPRPQQAPVMLEHKPEPSTSGWFSRKQRVR